MEIPESSNKAESDEAVNRDDLIIQQQRQIEQEITESIPLISDPLSVNELNNEYVDDQVYQSKVKDLTTKYKQFRRTRPDGNCFFRAFAYSYLEYLVSNQEEFTKFSELAHQSKDKLIKLGFPNFTIEDFHDTFISVINRVKPSESGDNQSALDEVHKVFNDQGLSDYVVVYLRLITSGQLQEGEDFYQNFIDGNCTIKEFCHQEVEPMYKESDHIHIIAICTALSIGVRVEYMDRGDHHVIGHDFPEGLKPTVFLLYRPGHYDILYPN